MPWPWSITPAPWVVAKWAPVQARTAGGCSPIFGCAVGPVRLSLQWQRLSPKWRASFEAPRDTNSQVTGAKPYDLFSLSGSALAAAR